jgi:hypothetical protein
MHDIVRWAASVGTIGAGLILAARVRPRITGWAFVVLSGASIIWTRLSNRGICAHGAKRGSDAYQLVRHLPMADLEGEGMTKAGARRTPLIPAAPPNAAQDLRSRTALHARHQFPSSHVTTCWGEIG